MPSSEFGPDSEGNSQDRSGRGKEEKRASFPDYFLDSENLESLFQREVIVRTSEILQQHLVADRWEDFEDEIKHLHHTNEISRDTVKLIMSTPLADLDSPNILFAYLQHCVPYPDRKTVETCLTLGADINVKDQRGNTALDMLLHVNPDPLVMKLLIERGGTFQKMNEEYLVKRDTSYERCSAKDILVETGALAKSLRLDETIKNELRSNLLMSDNLARGYHYLKAFEEATSINQAIEDRVHLGPYFLEYTKQMLYEDMPTTMTAMISAIEDLMDTSPELHGWHQSEAELALLLNNLNLDVSKGPDTELVNAITRAITSPHRVYFAGLVEFTPSAVDAVKQVGLLTHSFRFLRYETEQQREMNERGEVIHIPQSSIIEKFGFERIDSRISDRSNFLYYEYEQHPGFGRGYLLHPDSDAWQLPHLQQLDIEPGTWVEFRQGYMLASNSNGTLLIRNSSPTFGRDGLEHTAYWSNASFDNGLTESDLLNLDPKIFSNELLDTIFSIPNFREGLDDHPRVFALSQDLLKLKNAIKDWEFDTRRETAWSTDESTGQLYVNGNGHHFSTGFPHVVEFLNAKMRYNEQLEKHGIDPKPLPELSFFNRHLPAWTAEPFLLSSASVQQGERTRLPVDAVVLDLLTKLSRFDLRSSDQDAMKETGLEAFLAMGAKMQSQLVLVAPKSDVVIKRSE